MSRFLPLAVALSTLAAGCSNAPQTYTANGMQRLDCIPYDGTHVMMQVLNDGRRLRFSAPDLRSTEVAFVRRTFVEETYRGEGVEVVIDPEVVVIFDDGRRYSGCN